MELSSHVNDTWKYFAAGSFAGFFLLLLLAYQTHPYTTLLAAQNAVIGFTHLGETDAANSAPKPPSLGKTDAANSAVEPPSLGETDAVTSVAKPPSSGETGTATSAAEPDAATSTVSLGESDAATSGVTKDQMETFDLAINSEKQNSTIENDVQKFMNGTANKCNMFEGRWVYQPEEHPSYDSIKCPFIEEKMSCRKNGRPDFKYEKWRWEATDCDIPLFNGSDMLERLRNKRVIIAGDSLNRNMWESLACLLYSSIPNSTVEVQAVNPVYKVLKAKDYNCTVEFYWSPFLVEFVEKHVSGHKVLVLDKLSANSMQWPGADVMVFNSGHWWLHGGKMRSWDMFEYEGKLTEEMPIELAYERAMKTWATWINQNVDPNKTTVFFRSLSAVHQTSQDWCYNVTHPVILEEEESSSHKSASHKSDFIVETIKEMINGISNIQVKYLNISKLSQYRRDGHPSIYRSSQWKVLIKKFEDNLAGYADCSHWCLPGVPDTWNRLLYTFLFFDT